MRTLILDNYDSFTFNLYQEIGSLGGNPLVYRNDAITLDDVRRLGITHIVLGPGPGNPAVKRDIGISEELIAYAEEYRIPLLGVCLGHQILGKYFGGIIERAPSFFHGKSSHLSLSQASKIFRGMESGFEAMRYHSLCVDRHSIPSCLRVTALTDDNLVMAMEHVSLPIYGVQFHPESIGTPCGKKILANFLSLSPLTPRAHATDTLENQIEILLSSETSDDDRADVFSAYILHSLTPDTLARSARALRSHMVPVELPGTFLDTCGTGGSGKRTMNTSTITAFVVAACGVNVAKHGNKSASGNCGSFDLLEHLGVNILLRPEEEQRMFEELGIVFLFARLHHPALKHVALLRKAHGKKTIFNLLGPLCNPASASLQLIGASNESDARLLAEALTILGSTKSIVVSGLDGIDEVSACAPTVIIHVPSGQMSLFDPRDLGLPLADPASIEGGCPDDNATVFLALLRGEGTDAERTHVLLNAAHALVLANPAMTLRDAYLLAEETLLSGTAQQLFHQYRTLSQTLS